MPFRTRKDGQVYPVSEGGKTYKREYEEEYPKKSKTKIKYHDREGIVTIHMDEQGRKYMMVRKVGGGTKRLYEGEEYQPSKKSPKTKILELD